MKRLLAAVFVAGLVSSLALPPSTAVAQGADCEYPLVNTIISAEGAVSRPALRSPSEYALSNVYALIEMATKPQFTYAEAGPQYAGAFEALAPAGSPPPPRAVAAYPSEDIPDDDVEDWGGRSEASVTSLSASGASTGTPVGGFGDFEAGGSHSFASAVVECDVVTVVVGWLVSDAELAPGVTVEAFGETLTLVVGPDGSSAEIESVVTGLDGAAEVPLEGRPLDPFTDPMREGGGPTLEAGEPRTETTESGATATGGGFNLLFLDPESGQGASYRIGSINASIEILGPLDPPADPTVSTDGPPGPTPPPLSEPAELTPGARTVDRSVTGDPPAPSPTPAATVETMLVRDTRTVEFETRVRNWIPLFALLGSVAVALSASLVVGVGGRWFPTLAWISARAARGARRFSAVYLRW